MENSRSQLLRFLNADTSVIPGDLFPWDLELVGETGFQDEVPKLGGAYNLRQCRGLRGGAQDEVLPVVVNIKAPG